MHVLIDILYEEVVTGIWVPARIFTVTERVCKFRIKVVIDKFIKYKHHTFSGGRECPAQVKEMSDLLVQLCDLSPANLYTMMKNTYKLNKEWESDWKFYLNICVSPYR